MDLAICKTSEKAETLVAKLIADRIRETPDLALGLATGRTMERVYAELVRHHVSFRAVISFNLDEYIGIDRKSPHSYHSYMHDKLFQFTDIQPENVHLPDGMAADLKAAARDYEHKIHQAGGIDFQLLGIGRSGHVGFNEPFSSLSSRTRDKTLARTTREQNASLFGGDLEQVPTRALTMGVGTILEAKEIVLLATGAEKAKILAQSVEGPLTSMVTASALQLHPNCRIIVDEAAAAQLAYRADFEFTMHHDPDWEPYRDWLI